MTGSPTVSLYMTRDPITLDPGEDVTRAASTLLRRRISGAPVVDADGALVGMLTAKDCFRAMLHASYHQERAGPVSAFMTSPVETIPADMGIIEAAELFLARPYRRFPVMEDGRLAGIITRLDLLAAFRDAW
ncbi:MAG: CBS domain-containing protein [Rubricella sp.]